MVLCMNIPHLRFILVVGGAAFMAYLEFQAVGTYSIY
jgi:hypothetical protein